jgi:putative ABC transport system permease protein
MNLLNTLRVAYYALARNKMRSLLTMLGIIIGVGAVIAMIALGQGARASVQAQIASLGSNVILIFPGTTTQGGVRFGMGTTTTLTEDDATAMRKECPAVALVSETVRAVAQVVYSNQNWSTLIQGASPEYFPIRDWEIQSGTAFTDGDVRGAAKVCVVGQTVATMLFGDQDPVGAIIRIKKVPFKVIGVLARKGGTVMGADQDDLIVAPYTTVQKRILGTTNLGAVFASAVSQAAIPAASQEITALLRQRHRIQPSQDDDFTIRTQMEIATARETASRTMTILLGSIASVSLLVGGIGIMNIMLVSVTERTR